MAKKCDSSCPYYGVDENYNGYCKKDHNAYRERWSPCTFESDNSSSSSSGSYSSSSSSSSSGGHGCWWIVGIIVAIIMFLGWLGDLGLGEFLDEVFGNTTTTSQSAVRQSTTTADAFASVKEVTAVVYNVGDSVLNMRKEPNTYCEVLTTLSPGTVVTVLEQGTEWHHVQYGGYTGYCYAEYLEIQ